MTEKTLDDLIPPDPLMAWPWESCLRWALREKDILDRFKAETGLSYSPPKNLFEKMVDDSCGNDGFEFLRAFVIWFNANIWGDIHMKASDC